VQQAGQRGALRALARTGLAEQREAGRPPGGHEIFDADGHANAGCPVVAMSAMVRIGSREEATTMAMGVTAIPKYERFFRAAAEVDVDKDDLKRFSGFVFERTIDLLIRGQANAKANLRDTIEFWDLPITKGLQERIHEFEHLDRDIGLEPFLAELVAHPQLDLALSEDADARLPSVAGGLSVALGRSFRIVDPKLRNPSSENWGRAFALFDLLL
jgi:hypothetical protein